MMNRFVKHFEVWQGADTMVADLINGYAERNNLKIITIAPMGNSHIYVLFEEISTDER